MRKLKLLDNVNLVKMFWNVFFFLVFWQIKISLTWEKDEKHMELQLSYLFSVRCDEVICWSSNWTSEQKGMAVSVTLSASLLEKNRKDLWRRLKDSDCAEKCAQKLRFFYFWSAVTQQVRVVVCSGDGWEVGLSAMLLLGWMHSF